VKFVVTALLLALNRYCAPLDQLTKSATTRTHAHQACSASIRQFLEPWTRCSAQPIPDHYTVVYCRYSLVNSAGWAIVMYSRSKAVCVCVLTSVTQIITDTLKPVRGFGHSPRTFPPDNSPLTFRASQSVPVKHHTPSPALLVL